MKQIIHFKNKENWNEKKWKKRSKSTRNEYKLKEKKIYWDHER